MKPVLSPYMWIGSQVGVASARLSVDPSIFQLGEMALEETDLVFVRRTRNIGRRSLDRKMVVDRALVDSSFRLGNQLCPPHVAVPLRGVIDRDLSTLLAASVSGVLVVRRQVHVFGGSA